MNLLKRLHNIWILGEMEIKDGKLLPTTIKNEEQQTPKKMVEFIKMHDPVKEALEE